MSWEIRTGSMFSICVEDVKINPLFCWLMLKGSEIHHSESLPAQKANHLHGTSTMPRLPSRCVISRGSIRTAITPLYPLSDVMSALKTKARRGDVPHVTADEEAVWILGNKWEDEGKEEQRLPSDIRLLDLGFPELFRHPVPPWTSTWNIMTSWGQSYIANLIWSPAWDHWVKLQWLFNNPDLFSPTELWRWKVWSINCADEGKITTQIMNLFVPLWGTLYTPVKSTVHLRQMDFQPVINGTDDNGIVH